MVGVVTAPRSTYAEVAARPRALGVLVAVFAISALSLGAFMSTAVGRTAMLDQQMRTLESFGFHPSDAQYERMREQDARPPYLAVAGQAAFMLGAGALVAGVALAVFSLLGGDGTYRQTFAVVAHSGVILAIQQLFVMPLDYARQSISSPTNMAVFFPFLDENTYVARLIGSVDLFVVWWIVSVAIGFGALYKRRTGPIAATMFAIYIVIGAVLAGVKTALAGA